MTAGSQAHRVNKAVLAAQLVEGIMASGRLKAWG
jgi:hypothetical protein